MAREHNTSTGASNGQEHRVKGSEIFVGGLARTVTESNVREIFSPFGEIVELRMMKEQNGASKGFCFVRFATREAALKAQKEKNGIMVQGKKVGVSLSSDKDQLFFGNLRKDWSTEEFDKLVRQAFEDVVSVDLAMPPSSEVSPAGKKRLNRGFAFVQFSSHAAAARAYRIGSRTDFVLAGGWHPLVDWVEKEPEIDPEEMAKVKIAFIGNLPTNADEDFLRKLFEPLGKIERVALSRKAQSSFGFVHFANRAELENAIKEMDGKTVQGPQNGPTFKIQVAVAKSVEKDKKRVRDETTKPGRQSDSLSSGLTLDSLDPKSKAPRFANSVVDAADPYEEAVIALPSVIKERLLRIFRLGIATRYDVDVQCIASLKDLPEPAAITILDQFMLSGAEKHDKGAYFSSLLVKHQVPKMGSTQNSSSIPRTGTDFGTEESELVSLLAPRHTQAIDHAASRYSIYREPMELHSYSSPLSGGPFRTQSSIGRLKDLMTSSVDPVSRTSLGKFEPVPKSSLGKFEPVPKSSLGRLEEPVSLYRDSVSRSTLRRLEPVSRPSLGRLEDPVSSYRGPVSQTTLGRLEPVSRSNLGRLEDPLSSCGDPISRPTLGRLEPVPRPTGGRLEDPVSSYGDSISRLGRLEDPLSSCGDPISRPTLGRLEPVPRPTLGRLEDPVSSYGDSISQPTLGKLELVPQSTPGRLADPVSSNRDPISRPALERLEPVPRPTLERLADPVSSYQGPVSRPTLRRLEDPVSSYRNPVSRSTIGRLEDPIPSYRDPVARLNVARLEDPLSSYRDPRSSSLGYASGVRPVRSERPSFEGPQMKFDPLTGQPYKFDPFTGEPIRWHSPSRF